MWADTFNAFTFAEQFNANINERDIKAGGREGGGGGNNNI